MIQEIDQVCDEMYDAAKDPNLDHPDQFRIALRSFAERISENNCGDAQKVYVVFRVHGGPEATGFSAVCGVFRELGDAKACLGNEYRAARPGDKWILSEDPPGNNNYMRAEVVQTNYKSDRFEITEKEVM